MIISTEEWIKFREDGQKYTLEILEKMEDESEELQ